jgi:hypothetical protein
MTFYVNFGQPFMHLALSCTDTKTDYVRHSLWFPLINQHLHQAGEVTETAQLCLLPSFVFIILLPLSLALFYISFSLPSLQYTCTCVTVSFFIPLHCLLVYLFWAYFFITSVQELSNYEALKHIKIVMRYLNVLVVNIGCHIHIINAK